MFRYYCMVTRYVVDLDSIPTPKALSGSYFNNSKILSVAGGNSNSIFVTENGVYACGSDSNGSCAGYRSHYPGMYELWNMLY